MPRKKRLPAQGNCYEAAGKFIIDNLLAGEAERYNLVHGEVMGQGPLEGVQFGHAWIVDTTTDNVTDLSNGRNITLPRQIYYLLGQIDQIGNYHVYTAQEAKDMMTKYRNYGPWDLVTSSGL